MIPSTWYSASISSHTAPVSTATIRTSVPASESGVEPARAHRRAVDEPVELVERDGRTDGQRRGHARRAHGLDADQLHAGVTLGQPRDHAGDQAAAAHRRDDPSGARPSCSTISRATVPWPATVRGSSNAGTIFAPLRAACSTAAVAAAS